MFKWDVIFNECFFKRIYLELSIRQIGGTHHSDDKEIPRDVDTSNKIFIFDSL